MVAGAGAGAMVLTDPMVDPRGGALTVGLGLVDGMAVVAHYGESGEDSHGEKLHRSVVRSPPTTWRGGGVPARTALIRDPAGSWRQAGRRRWPSSWPAARPAAGLQILPIGADRRQGRRSAGDQWFFDRH